MSVGEGEGLLGLTLGDLDEVFHWIASLDVIGREDGRTKRRCGTHYSSVNGQ